MQKNAWVILPDKRIIRGVRVIGYSKEKLELIVRKNMASRRGTGLTSPMHGLFASMRGMAIEC